MFLFGSVYIPIMIIMSQAAECTRYAWSKTYLQRVGHEQHRICVHPHVPAVSSNGKGPVRPRVKAVKGRFVGFQDVRFQQTLPESCLTDLVQARFIQRLIENLKYKTLETLIFENQQSRCGCMGHWEQCMRLPTPTVSIGFFAEVFQRWCGHHCSVCFSVAIRLNQVRWHFPIFPDPAVAGC